MKYVEKHLVAGERIIRKAHISALTLLPTAALALAFIVVTCLVGRGKLVPYAMLVGIAMLLPKWVGLMSVELAVTNRRVIGKSGIVRLSHMDCPLDRVDTVSVKSGVMGTLLGYGDITIATSSGRFEYHNIAGANAFKQALLEEVDRYKAGLLGQRRYGVRVEDLAA